MTGRATECPDEYLLVRAARYLGVTPWELAEKPAYWMNLALSCQAGEDLARARRQAKDPLADLGQ